MAARKRSDLPAAPPSAAATRAAQEPAASERPTEQSLASWYTRQWERWRAVRDKDDAIRSRIARRSWPSHVGPQGEGNELAAVVIRSGTLKTLEREFTGILSSVPPRIEALAKGVGPVFQRRADVLEEWAQAWYKAVGGDRVATLVDTNQLRYGRGVFFVAWASQFWQGLPRQRAGEADKDYNRRVEQAKREAPPAIVVYDRPAPQCLWEEDDLSPFLGPARACYWEVRPLSELANRYPGSKVAQEYARARVQPDFSDDSRLHVCWANRRYLVYATAGAAGGALFADPARGDRTSAALLHSPLAGWEVLDTYAHQLNRCPFVIQDAGPSDDPELVQRYEGLFDNSLDLIDHLDDLLTQAGTLARRYARAVPIVEWQLGPGGTLPPGVDVAKIMAQPIEWQPDRVQNFWPGQRPGWWQPDLSALKELQELLGVFERYIQRDTLAPSSYGHGVATESGFQLVTLIEAGERKLRTLLASKKAAHEAVLDLVMRWVARIAGPDGAESTGVVVRAVVTEEGSGGPLAKQITKEDFLTLTADQAATASLAVHVEARLEAADAASAQIGGQLSTLVSNNLLDLDPAYLLARYFHLENPERHQKAADLWRFLKRPELANWVARQALEEAQMLQGKQESAFVQELASLSPAELMLIPSALQQVLAARGLLPMAGGPPNVAGPTPGPNGAAAGLAPPAVAPPGANGAVPAAPVPGTLGPVGGMGVGANPALASLAGQFAPQGPPSPMAAGSAPGSARLPGLGMPAAGPGGPVRPAGAPARSARRAGGGAGRPISRAGLPGGPRRNVPGAQGG